MNIQDIHAQGLHLRKERRRESSRLPCSTNEVRLKHVYCIFYTTALVADAMTRPEFRPSSARRYTGSGVLGVKGPKARSDDRLKRATSAGSLSLSGVSTCVSRLLSSRAEMSSRKARLTVSREFKLGEHSVVSLTESNI